VSFSIARNSAFTFVRPFDATAGQANRIMRGYFLKGYF